MIYNFLTYPYFYNTFLVLFSIGMYFLFLGLFGLTARHRNLLLTLIALELMLLGTSLLFIIFGTSLVDIKGQNIALILLVLAGSESALGLALTMLIYRIHNSINLLKISSLKH